jgi:periplasmic divalent cation tolerance protein
MGSDSIDFQCRCRIIYKLIESDPIERYIHSMNDKLQVVLCTAPDADTAQTLATALVTEKLAACVNIIPGITSIYRWKGAVEQDTEQLLLIKTAAAGFQQLAARIRALHPYELPEIISVPIDTGQQDYIQWITDSLK